MPAAYRMARETPPHPWEHDVTDTGLAPYFGTASIDGLLSESRIRGAMIFGTESSDHPYFWYFYRGFRHSPAISVFPRCDNHSFSIVTSSPKCPDRSPASQPLTPLEHLMLQDARPGYSMSFFVETSLHGPLCKERFRRCVHALVPRHPRLGSRVRKRLRAWEWSAPDRVPSVEWFPIGLSERATDALANTSVDLRETSGVRFIAIETAPRVWRVVMHVHHAVCDGVASLEVLGDLWSLYHESSLPDFRAGKAVAALPAADMAPDATVPWWHTVREFLTNRPAVVASLAAPRETIGAAAWPPYTTVAFSADLTQRLRQAAEAASATVNDVVVAATMRAIAAWNAAAGAPERTIRINMPTNLRPAGSRSPAANEMSYAFLDRMPSDCSSYHTLVQSLASASKWIQTTRATEQFLDVLATCCRIPGLLTVITRLPLCFSTAVVSNVGNVVSRMRTNAPIRDGRICPADLTITHVNGVPPLRPLTRVAVGVTTYQAVMTLSVMCAPGIFTPAMQQELADRIGQEITVFANGNDSR